MIVCAALVVRNIYHPYIKSDATEAESLRLARIVGALVVAGSVAFSLTIYDMFANLQLTWIVPMLFAAVFWVGMYWRRATTSAAWITFTFCLLFFLVLPIAVFKLSPGVANSPAYTRTSYVIKSTIIRTVTPLDVARGQATTADVLMTEIKWWGGVVFFWIGGVKLVGDEKFKEIDC